MIARQYDNLSRRLEVIGDLPEGWEWAMLVKVDGAQDIIYLEPMGGGAGVTLTRDQLALAGYYSLQLRGTQGDVVRHTNITQTFVPESLTGTGQWPSVPSEFLQVESRILELNQHPPIPGEDGFWQIWDPDTDQYETSAFPLPEGGSGADVTAAGIRDALGYTPANEETVSQLSEDLASKNFRHIVTMENTVDNTVTLLTVDVDVNGNPFSLDEICMICYCPIQETGNQMQLYFGFQNNHNEFFCAANFMHNTTERSSVINVVRRPDGNTRAEMFSSAIGSEWIAGSTSSNNTVCSRTDTTEKIKEVKLYNPSGFPVGVKVEVYGRDSV